MAPQNTHEETVSGGDELEKMAGKRVMATIST